MMLASEGLASVNQPDIVLVGSGVGDGLHLTVESERILGRIGRAVTLGVGPVLRQHLRHLGIELAELDDRLDAVDPARGYLEIAREVLARAQADPPVAAIVPGHPMLSNAPMRLVVMQARELNLTVQVLAGVSPIDAAIAVIGLDVGGFGLQVFDARRLVRRRQRLDPAVPLLILQPAGMAAAGADGPAPGYAALQSHLARYYPALHHVTHIADAPSNGRPRVTTVPLARLAELEPSIDPGSVLFVDLVRTPPTRPSTSAQVPTAT